jgi:hypothetical protein
MKSIQQIVRTLSIEHFWEAVDDLNLRDRVDVYFHESGEPKDVDISNPTELQSWISVVQLIRGIILDHVHIIEIKNHKENKRKSVKESKHHVVE